MHSIWRRLMYYGIGLLVGLLFVLILFGTRGCNWLPKNRIKASVFSQIIVLDTTDLGLKLDDKSYIELLSDGDIDIALSMRKGEPKSYYFSHTFNDKSTSQVQATFETDGVVAVIKPIKEKEKTRAHINDNWFPIIHVPGGDSNFINFPDEILPEFKNYGLNKSDVYEALKFSGSARTIAQDADTLKRKIHDFRFVVRNKQYRAKAKIYKNALDFLFIKEE